MSSKQYDSHTRSDLSSSAVPPHGLDRRRARSREGGPHLVEALVQLAPDATVVADARGRIRLVNHQTEELFGYSADELLGQPVELLLPERLHELHRLHRQDYTAAPQVRPMGATLSVSGRRRDGSEFPLEASLGPLNEKGELLFIVSMRDITERQQAYATHAAVEAANRDLRALQAITDTALSHLALDDLLPALLERITHILQVDNAAVLLLDDDGQTLTMQAVRGLEEAMGAHVRVPLGQGFAGRIAAMREPLVVDDLATFPVVNLFLHEHLRSVAGVPLLFDSQVLGVVHVGMAEARHFRAHEVQLLQQVADRMAHSIDRARLYSAEQRARAEAEQRVAQLAAIFDAMADGVVVFDAQGRLVQENAAQQRLEGIGTAPPFRDMPLAERLALFAARDENGRPLRPDEGPLPRALRGEVVSGVETMDFLSRTLDGREVELNVSAAPLWDQEGHLRGAVAIFRDQTEQKRLERERAEQAEQLNRIFEGIADGLVVYNAEGQPVRLNAEARRILGLDAAPSDYAQLPAYDRAVLYEARDGQGRPLAPKDWPLMRVLSGQVIGADTREVQLRMLDGRNVEVITSAAPLWDRDGHLVGAVTILHDQTEQKRLAQEREEARARELAAQQVTEQMNAFLATAAHDIRNPLTVAAAQVQMARRRVGQLVAPLTGTAEPPRLLAERALESLEAAHASMGKLQRLVNLLFDVTQAQAQKLVLHLASVDLRTLVQQQVAAQQVTDQEHRIRVQVPDEAIVVEVDADRLEEVLDNFVSNALKYSPADQPVTIRLEVVDHHAVTSIIDHGPGLPPEEQSRIWEMFYRSPHIQVQHDDRDKAGSLGLGLHICKQLVELHPGGSVGVKSRVGEGSTFWFQLPLASK